MCAERFLVVCEKYVKYFLNKKKGERKENTDCYKDFQRIFRNSSKCGILHWAPEISFMTLNQGRIRGFFIRGEGNL